MPGRIFLLAPMSGVFRMMTGVILGLVPLLILFGVAANILELEWAAGGVVLGSIGVWLFYRPTRLEVTGEALVITWPLRRTRIAKEKIASTRLVETTAEAKDLLGTGFRVGVGGLFGTFGIIWTKHKGAVTVYITRTERLVLIERHGKRPMLLSPDDADGFVAALESEAAPAAA